MNLSRHFFEPETRVKLLPDGILVERFDLGDLHALLAEKIDRMFEQRAPESVSLMGGIDGEVGNPADSALRIQARGDVTDDVTVGVLGDEDAVGLETTIIGDGLGFALRPAALAKGTEKLFHVAIDGDGAEGLRGDLQQARKILWAIGADGEAGAGVCVHKLARAC